MAKKRTQNKFRNACVQGIRQAFKRYSPKYQAVLDKATIEEIGLDALGRQRKLKFIVCSWCQNKVKLNECHVDHIDPVIPLDKTYKDFNLQEICDRIDCDPSNLQVLCKPCHDKKTEKEKLEKSQLSKKK